MSDDERRKLDEHVRFKLIEGQARIETLIGSTANEIKALRDENREHAMAIAELRYALFGGPKDSDVGLMEKYRRIQKNWTIVITICVFIFSALGKSLAPYLGKLVTDYIHDSPSEKWRVEQRRPKVRVYKIYSKPEPPAEP